MSSESYEWLNGGNILVGNGLTTWWNKPDLQPNEPVFYPGPIPIEDVVRRLFGWDAVESPIYYQVANPAFKDDKKTPDEAPLIYLCDDSRKVIYRSDTHKVIGAHSDSYQGHSYKEWLLDMVASILDADLGINSAGLLKGGAQAWVQVGLPETIKTPDGVEFLPLLLATTSFDGILATMYNRCVMNAICDNTMGIARNQGGDQKIKVKHTRNSLMRLTDAREALSLVHSISDEFSAQVAELCNTTVTDQQYADFLNAITPIPEDDGRGKTQAQTKQGELSRLWRYDSRVAPWQNSAYGVVQAVNTYEHHYAITRGRDGMSGDDLRAMRNAEKMVGGYYDDLDRHTMDALNLILAR